MKENNIIIFPKIFETDGNLSLKCDIEENGVNIEKSSDEQIEVEQPKVKKIVIGKRKPRIFAGCWEVANGEDFC